MNIIDTQLKEVKIIEPKIWQDTRGFFYESFNLRLFQQTINTDIEFVQDNYSCSQKNVLRGLHYQLASKAQDKLIYVVKGAIFDIAVDIRKNSPTFGQWVSVHLSAENKKQLWIPQGFAHGFLALTDNTEIIYKTTTYYAPESERSIRWDDPTLGIQWPIKNNLIMSDKDKQAPLLYV